MKTRFLFTVAAAMLLVACTSPEGLVSSLMPTPPSITSTQSSTNSEPVDEPSSTISQPPPPEGITITTVQNYKSFALINYPYGSGFTQNQDVDVDRNSNDAGEFVPGLKFNRSHVLVWSELRDTDGDLDVQFEALKKKVFTSQDIENSTIDYEKMRIGDRDVALIRVKTPVSGDAGIDFSYGYLVAHDEHSAACFMLNEMLIWKADDEKLAEYEKELDKGFIYMIETVKFR